ncbi:MAG: hypothetical protein P1V35_04610, partial [Planctomycetota bacterium]|nr:hypothetical protein [Planctomycetota bacterium]
MRSRFLFIVLLIGCLWALLELRDARDGQANYEEPGATAEGAPDLTASEELLGIHDSSSPVRKAAEEQEPIVEEIFEDGGADDDFEEAIDSFAVLQDYWAKDPLPKGTCSLSLNFYDSETGEAVSGTASLWRLGVPANEWWTEGDRWKDQFDVKQGFANVGELVPGRYRVYAHFARLGADSAPEFAVEGGQTSIRIPVHMPRPSQARLHLVDFQGSPVVESTGIAYEVQDVRASRVHRGEVRPDWVRRRVPTDTSIRM